MLTTGCLGRRRFYRWARLGLSDVLETQMARYDAVIYFANPRPRAQLERLKAEHHWPKLVIRDIPQPSR